jgi:hypothetical protein
VDSTEGPFLIAILQGRNQVGAEALDSHSPVMVRVPRSEKFDESAQMLSDRINHILQTC